MRLLYTCVLVLLLPWTLLHLLLRARRQPGYLRHVAERFGYYQASPQTPLIWLHAVSVGETRAAEPLVRALQARNPQCRILLTHMTPTGRDTGEALFGGTVERCYLPYDYPGAVARFLEHFKPRAGIVMETEIWFNLIHACTERGIPLHLVNARLSEKSFTRYLRIRRLAQAGLNELASIAAQTSADAQRFEALGARNVQVVGNVKFDISPAPELVALGQSWRASWGVSRPVWLAASTRAGEEVLLLEVLDQIHVPGLLTIIVPRHPQRFDEVAQLLRRRAISYSQRSRGEWPDANTRVWLGDTMGEMSAYYAACDVAFIGGSLRPFGAHNLLEACVAGKPVIVGPSTYNFQEATELGVAAGGVVQVQDAAAVATEVTALLTDTARRKAMGDAAHSFAESHRGAVDRLFELLNL